MGERKAYALVNARGSDLRLKQLQTEICQGNIRSQIWLLFRKPQPTLS